MTYNTLNKKVLFILLGVLCLPCGIMLVLSSSILWTVLLILALSLSVFASWVHIGISLESITVYGYLLYGREYKFNTVKEIVPQFNDFKNPDIPDALQLTSGDILRIGIFSPGKRQRIFHDVQQQLKASRAAVANFAPWLKQRQKNKGKELLIIGIFTLLCGLGYTADILYEVWKVETWTPHETIIRERGTKKVRRNRRTRTIDTVKYEYVWNGKVYQGDSILFDTRHLPRRIQPGRQWFCLVNPDDPSDSTLPTGRNDRRYHFRFIFPGIILTGGLIVLLFAFRAITRKPPVIPQELLDYMDTFPKSELTKLHKRSRHLHTMTNAAARVPFEIIDGRYGLFPQKHSMKFWIFWIVLCLPFIAGAFFSPIMLLGVLYPIIIFTLFIIRTTVVLDFEERVFFYCTFFRPGKKVKKTHSLDKICYMALAAHQKNGHIQLTLVEKGGAMHVIGTAHPNDPAVLLASAPMIAEKLGHLPIVAD